MHGPTLRIALLVALPAWTGLSAARARAGEGLVAVGVSAGAPAKAAVSLSYLHGRFVPGGEWSADGVRGLLADVEVGLGAGRLGVGWGSDIEMAALGVKASVLRTWGRPWLTERDLTYVGPEVDFVFLYLRAKAGLVWRIQGSGGRRTLFTFGIGLRLPPRWT
jgi:hypothetical protein